MTGKFTAAAGVVLGACVALGGCQNSPPKTASNQPTGFSQGSSTPPIVQPNGGIQQAGTNFNQTPNGTVTYPGTPSGVSSVPSTAPSTLGSQSRTTFVPNNGGSLSNGPGFGAPDTALGNGPQTFNPPPLPPPSNPGFPK